MRRQVIAGAAIVVISVASAAAYTVMEGQWFGALALLHGALPSEAAGLPSTVKPERSSDARHAATAARLTQDPTNGSARTPAPSAQASAAPPSAQQTPGASPPAASHASSPPTVPKPAFACNNPNAMGVSRVVQIDTTGGPAFGSGNFKIFDFLRDHEVVLTFDDGPWRTTPAVLKALADQCLRATFFPIGKHATYYPEILRQVIAAGHTVGSHTWSHADLAALMKKSGLQAAEAEIEKGASAVHLMAGAPIAPFVRFPYLRHPPEVLAYLATRNIATFSCDIDAADYKIKKPEELVKSLMAKLNKRGKGIILMHDFQKVTSIALPEILRELQKNGYKVVHMVPKTMLATLPQYDEEVRQENKLQTMSDSKPLASVVRTISGD